MALLSINEWKKTGLLPTAGLAAWYACEPSAGSTSIAAPDFSGGGYDLVGTAGAGNSPTIQANVYGGLPAWYFNGTTNQPLKVTTPITYRHIFTLAAFEEPTFTQYRGLITGVASGDILIGNNTGIEFYFLSSAYQYRLNAVLHGDNDWRAPLNKQFGLVEFLFPSPGAGYDGVQIGQQTNQAGRRFKGWFAESLIYNVELSQTDIERVRLYFNLKYGIWKKGVPLYFPSDDLLPYRRTRFYASPADYNKITDTYEYEDGGRDFNEVASSAPQRWEYEYLYRTPEQAKMFDAFYDQVRLKNPFFLRDKYGTVHSNVRVESYSRTHESHKSWRNDVKFRLVKYP